MTEPAARDTWSPDQYARFRDERKQPFYDLMAMVRPQPGMRVVDLGCGPGELTRELHDSLGAGETLGVDSSDAMLSRSGPHAGAGVRFEKGDIRAFAPTRPYDLVFSNAALQWIEDHPTLLRQITSAVAEGGQLAVQVPDNWDHISHTSAAELADQSPFRDVLGGYTRPTHVLRPERYAELLDELGYGEQSVQLRVYPHRLPARDAVIEWVKGSLLTEFQRRLPPDLFDEFLTRYRALLLPRLSNRQPFFYGFKRILFWARRPAR